MIADMPYTEYDIPEETAKKPKSNTRVEVMLSEIETEDDLKKYMQKLGLDEQ